jgi:apolipoprotein N-acyltransferase
VKFRPPDLAARLRALTRWRRALASAGLGVALTLALPPLHLVPLAVPAFAGLLWLIESSGSARGAFRDGWWFGVGHFATGLYWISHALLVDAASFGWLIPFALAGFGAGLGVFTGLAALVAHQLRRRRIAMPIALAMGWLLAEWLRGHVLTGFAWNLVATMWPGAWPMPWLASVVGAYGLSAITVALAATVAVRRRRVAMIAIGVFLAAFVIGLADSMRDGGVTTRDGEAKTRLRLVQPNIAQTLKWDPRERDNHLRRMLELTANAGTRVVIWPEASTVYPIADNAELRRLFARLLPSDGYLLAGAIRVERGDASLRFWNSLHALGSDGVIAATYDKFHLVPFGEYVPLADVLPIGKLVPIPGSFQAGAGPVTIALPGLPPFSPLICYEIIFPGRVVARGQRPQWILNVTNDAWFGISAGPYQHFAAARMRAIEEGLPVVRVANNGISAVIAANGRVMERLDLGVGGFLDVDLPSPAPPTIYARIGDFALLPLAFFGLLLGFFVGRKIE